MQSVQMLGSAQLPLAFDVHEAGCGGVGVFVGVFVFVAVFVGVGVEVFVAVLPDPVTVIVPI